jgi:hypothetical protein
MIIPNAELTEIRANGNFSLRCAKANVQLSTFPSKPNQIFLIEFDALGNAKKSQEFNGVEGFWTATREFEKVIADKLGLRDVAGFEVGMVVQLQRDYSGFQKGAILMITEVNQDGQATAYQRLDNRDLTTIKKSPAYSRLVKSSDKEILNAFGIASPTAIDIKKEYDVGAMDNEILLENTTKVGDFVIDDLASIKPSKGGGVFKIQGFSFVKNDNAKYVISAFGNFEDGAIGSVPLKDFKKK